MVSSRVVRVEQGGATAELKSLATRLSENTS